MKIYFARPITLYGTPQDKRDIQLLEKLQFIVVDPSETKYELEYKTRGMEVYTDLVKSCQVLAYRSFPDLSITAGVFTEINAATEAGLPVIELPTILKRRVLDKNETRLWLQLIGTR